MSIREDDSVPLKISISQTLVPIRTPGGTVKHNTSLTPRVSASVGFGCGTRINISNKYGCHILSFIDSNTENKTLKSSKIKDHFLKDKGHHKQPFRHSSQLLIIYFHHFYSYSKIIVLSTSKCSTTASDSINVIKFRVLSLPFPSPGLTTCSLHHFFSIGSPDPL